MLAVRAFDPTHTDLDAWCAQFSAGYARDSGTVLPARSLAARIRSERASEATYRWSAELGSEIVGVAQLNRKDSWGFLRLYVPPEHRHNGIGRALLGAVWADSGVTSLRAVVNAGESGERFAMSHGARVLMRLVVMSQQISEFALEPTPIPDGYDLVCWREHAPEELLASYAAAKCHIADAPNSHLQVDPRWSVARVRSWEDSFGANGQELWVAAATRDGGVVGFTEIATSDHCDASQEDTVVLPQHRRSGLATRLKTELVRRVRNARPDVASVSSTINADHRAMIAVNSRLGYRVVRQRLNVEAQAGG